MPLVPAKCTQCGANLEIDPSKEAAICQYCQTPFITEKAINNYNTTNITNIGQLHADVINLSDGTDLENLIKSADTFLNLDEYISAKQAFRKATEKYPYDYRGWWGLLRLETHDFLDISLEDWSLVGCEDLFSKAMKTAPEEQKDTLQQKYTLYNEYRKKRIEAKHQFDEKIKQCKKRIDGFKEYLEDCDRRELSKRWKVEKRINAIFWIVFIIFAITQIVCVFKNGIFLSPLISVVVSFVVIRIIYLIIDSYLCKKYTSKHANNEANCKNSIDAINQEVQTVKLKYEEYISALNEEYNARLASFN